MSWSEASQWLSLGGNEIHWIFKVFLVVFVTLVVNFIVKIILARLEGQLRKTRNLWDDTLLEAAGKPISYFLWLLGLSWAAEIAQSESGEVIFDAVGTVRQIGVVVLLTWFLIRFVGGAEKILISPDKMKQPMDQTTVMALSKILRASIIITSILVIMQTLGYSISGVLAFGGIGGIAVGFAAKDLLANFFGGLMIYLDRPFSVGDWIRSPDKNIEGVVEHIGWRQTCIRTFDKRPLYVPNSTFTTISVENPSRMTHRRIYETLGVRYDDFAVVGKIVDDILLMLKDHPDIDQTQTMIVNFNAFNNYSLDFFMYTFTKTTNWIEYHRVKQDVLIKVMNIIASHGGEMAFPTQTLHVPEQIQILEQQFGAQVDKPEMG